MQAYLLPRKDKYFAVTKADGSFEIRESSGRRGDRNSSLARAGRWSQRSAGAGQQGVEVDHQGPFQGRSSRPTKRKDLALDVPDGAFK